MCWTFIIYYQGLHWSSSDSSQSRAFMSSSEQHSRMCIFKDNVNLLTYQESRNLENQGGECIQGKGRANVTIKKICPVEIDREEFTF